MHAPSEQRETARYKIIAPTSVPGIRIPRSLPAVYIVMCDGKRLDSFLSRANAVREVKRLIDESSIIERFLNG